MVLMDKIYFTKEMVNFYENLKLNNSKEWFLENRKVYDEKIIPAAKEFTIDMGKALESIVPNIKYAPKIDGSIFRIHKDARINKGKAPFKTHLGIIFWLGDYRLESPCFYFQISPPFYYIEVGLARFDNIILQSYRQIVNNKKYQDILINIKKIASDNYFNILGDKLKNVPKGINAISEVSADFLKYKNIYLSDEMPINSDFYSPKLFSYVYDNFKKMKDFLMFLDIVIKNSKK